MPNNIHLECREESLKSFKTENTTGIDIVVDPNDKVKSTEIYASCLKDKGLVFNASYIYCYKFKSICNKYDKYRK